VVCAALWPDPADAHCPVAFRERAVEISTDFAGKCVSDKGLAAACSEDTWARWQQLAKLKDGLRADNPEHLNSVRSLLLDFIADFANWDNSTVPAYLETSRALTQAAHEALGGEGTRRVLPQGPRWRDAHRLPLGADDPVRGAGRGRRADDSAMLRQPAGAHEELLAVARQPHPALPQDQRPGAEVGEAREPGCVLPFARGLDTVYGRGLFNTGQAQLRGGAGGFHVQRRQSNIIHEDAPAFQLDRDFVHAAPVLEEDDIALGAPPLFCIGVEELGLIE